MRCVSIGEVFSFHLLDAQEGQMWVVAFDRVAEKFHDRVQAGSVYKISNADIAWIRYTVCWHLILFSLDHGFLFSA